MGEELLFEYAPISLWEEDFSQVKSSLEALRREGVTDLSGYLDKHPEFIAACMGSIQVLRVNQKTLELFKAASQQDVLDHLDQIFRDDMRGHFRMELLEIWNGTPAHHYEGVNYDLAGKAVEINLHWQVLPGYEETLEHVLVSIDDIRGRKQAERRTRASEARYHGLFEHSPISLWEQDFSAVKHTLDKLRAFGVVDLDLYLDQHPELIKECMAQIQVLDVNQRTVQLFKAQDKQELLENLDQVFKDDMTRHFREEMLMLWEGRLSFQMEGVNYTLTGEPVQIQLFASLLPGHEQKMDRVLISLIDITARKKAEDYLRYLGTHDVLTGLYNRAFFEEERSRLQRSRRSPVCVLATDVDGLKRINDTQGHAAGDDLLRRVGEVLRSSFRAEDAVARIGGDEFAVLLPETDAESARQAIDRIHKMVELNNAFYSGQPMVLSIGFAIGQQGDDLEAVQRQADDRMYQEKSRHKSERQQALLL